MTTGRGLLIIGALISATGAAGLVAWGASPVEVFEVLTFRITGDAFDNYFFAVCCAIVFVVGQVVGSVGLGLQIPQQSISLIGRILIVISGLGTIAAALFVAMGLQDMMAAFDVIATSQVAPTPDEVQVAMTASTSFITTGYTILLIASILQLPAAFVGYQNRAGKHRLTVMRHLPTPLAALAGICYIAFWMMSSNHATALKDTITTNPKPRDLAAHLDSILTNSLFGCGMLFVVAIAVAAAAMLAPGPGSR